MHIYMTLLSYKNLQELRIITGASLIECKKALLNNNYDVKKSIDYINRYGKGNKLNINFKLLNQGVILDKYIYENNQYVGVLLELGCETDFVSQNKDFVLAGYKILKFVITHKIFEVHKINKLVKPFLIQLMNRFGENIKVTKIYYLLGNYITSYNHNKRIAVLLSLIKPNDIDKNKLYKKLAMHIAANNPLYISKQNIHNSILTKVYNEQLLLAKNTGKSNDIINKILTNRLNNWKKEVCLLEQPFIFDNNKLVKEVLQLNNIIIDSSIRIELGKNCYTKL